MKTTNRTLLLQRRERKENCFAQQRGIGSPEKLEALFLIEIVQ